MKISRGDFLDLCRNLGLESDIIEGLENNLTNGRSLPIVWLSSGCTGCTEELADLAIGVTDSTGRADLLVDRIDFKFHGKHCEIVDESAINTLLNAFAGKFFLVVEGGFAKSFGKPIRMPWAGGQTITAFQAVRTFAPKAEAVLCIGTCACFGVPGGRGFRSVESLARVETIKISGCPTHPSRIVWTLAQLLAGRVPVKDIPSALFPGTGKTVDVRNCA